MGEMELQVDAERLVHPDLGARGHGIRAKSPRQRPVSLNQIHPMIKPAPDIGVIEFSEEIRRRQSEMAPS